MEHAIEISMDDVDPDIAPQLRAYAERRLSFALRRFQEHIRHVRLRLTDVNGPRHGVDARCAVTAHLTNGKQVFVESTTAWPFRSVTQAAGRLSEAIRRLSSCNRPFQSEGSSRRLSRRLRRDRLA
jgi:ribosome hibernation promoting factor